MKAKELDKPLAMLALSIAASTAGCASTPQTPAPLPVLTAEASAVQMTGMASGTLIADGGCIRLTRPTGPSRLVVWPSGTRFSSGATQEITLSNSKSVVVGRPVRLGGGEREDLPKSMLAIPPAAFCPGPYFIAADLID